MYSIDGHFIWMTFWGLDDQREARRQQSGVVPCSQGDLRASLGRDAWMIVGKLGSPCSQLVWLMALCGRLKTLAFRIPRA